MKRMISLFLSVMFMLLLFTSCGNTLLPDSENPLAVAVILGRHANANAFPEVFYQQLTGDIQQAVYGGFVSVIIGDGSPREIVVTDKNGKPISFVSDAKNRTILEKRISDRTEDVMSFIKDESNKAIVSENDLLRAIKEARASLNNPSVPSNAEKKIIILDTCISTTGDFKLQDLKLDSQKPNPKDIANELKKVQGMLPDLEDIKVRIVGLGDVAAPQDMNDETKLYLKELMLSILQSCGAIINDTDILVAGIGGRDGITSGIFPNKTLNSGDDGFPPVSTVKILSNALVFDNGGFTNREREIQISVDKLGFTEKGDAFENDDETISLLKEYSETVKSFIDANLSDPVYIAYTGLMDENFSEDSNFDLPQKRAVAIKQALVQICNIPEEHLVATTHIYVPSDEISETEYIKTWGESDSIWLLIPDSDKFNEIQARSNLP